MLFPAVDAEPAFDLKAFGDDSRNVNNAFADLADVWQAPENAAWEGDDREDIALRAFSIDPTFPAFPEFNDPFLNQIGPALSTVATNIVNSVFKPDATNPTTAIPDAPTTNAATANSLATAPLKLVASDPFISRPPLSSDQSQFASSQGQQGLSGPAIAGIVVGAVLSAVLIAVSIFFILLQLRSRAAAGASGGASKQQPLPSPTAYYSSARPDSLVSSTSAVSASRDGYMPIGKSDVETGELEVLQRGGAGIMQPGTIMRSHTSTAGSETGSSVVGTSGSGRNSRSGFFGPSSRPPPFRSPVVRLVEAADSPMANKLVSLIAGLLPLILLVLLADAGKVPQWVEDDFQEASKQIDFLGQKNFTEITSKGAWLVFFGIYWCPHCKLLTPKWRDFQRDAKEDLLKKDFHIAKVECSENEELCEGEQQIFGFPVIRLFRNGKLVEEIEAPAEHVELIKYAHTKADSFIDGSYDKEQAAKEEAAKAAAAANATAPDAAKAKDATKPDLVPAPPPIREKSKEELEQDKAAQEERDLEHGIEKAIAEAKAIGDSLGKPRIGANPDGVVVHLTDKTYPTLTKDADWFIMFHAPWCGHCKNMAPTWEQFAAKMKGKVNVGKVDCTTESNLQRMYGIKGFPTLRYVFGGEPSSAVEFRGGRNVGAFENFVNGLMSAPFEVVRSSQFDDIFHSKDVAFFYLYDPLNYDKALLEQFAKVSHVLRGQAPIYVSPDPSSFKRLGLDAANGPALVAAKDGGTIRKVFKADLKFTTESEQLNLKNWIVENKKPLVAQMNQYNGAEILQGDKYVVVGFLNPSAINHAESLGLLRLIAKDWHTESKDHPPLFKQVSFTWLDGLEHLEYVQRVYKIQPRDLPRVVIVYPELDQFYDVDASGKHFKFEKDAILAAIRDVQASKLKVEFYFALQLKPFLQPKSTSGWFAVQLRKFAMAIKPATDFFFEYAFFILIIALFFLMFTCYWHMREPEGQYAAVKTDPKAE
ncbi:hypothetical protein HDU96_007033 [Phlyctochytrium bullatum]|nr:hypothetical protein HDU96_007033 [Phlyctochytrium bullatum]